MGSPAKGDRRSVGGYPRQARLTDASCGGAAIRRPEAGSTALKVRTTNWWAKLGEPCRMHAYGTTFLTMDCVRHAL